MASAARGSFEDSVPELDVDILNDLFLWKFHPIYNFPIDNANLLPRPRRPNQRNLTNSRAPIERSCHAKKRPPWGIGGRLRLGSLPYHSQGREPSCAND